MLRRRGRCVLTGSLAVVLVASLAACSHKAPALGLPTPSARPSVVINPTPKMPAAATGPFVTTGRGPAVPDSNAWFGAFVGGTDQTASGKMNSVNTFQRLVGRKLAVVHSFHPWGSDFPSLFDQDIVQGGQVDMVSWAGTSSTLVANGTYDQNIRAFADSVRDFAAPILLRYRWEMDRPNLTLTVGSGAQFVAAWKHVRQIFTQEHATNAAWVWCPTSNAFANGLANSYYPGDDQVDWLCTDVYPNNTSLSFAAIMAPVMQFARQHPRPLIIGELGVEASTSIAPTWFANVPTLLAGQPQIKGVVYFSNATTTKPVYDTTIGDPPATLTAFRSMISSQALSAPTPK